MQQFAAGRLSTARATSLPFLLAALLVSAGCRDVAAPPDAGNDPALAVGQAGTADVIVVLDDRFAPGGGAANRARAAEVAQGLGLAAVHTYGTALFGFSATVPAAQMNALRAHPMVAHVELDRLASLPDPVRQSEVYGAQAAAGTQVVPWGVDRTGARQSGRTGAGVHVYVLDTGIDPNHSDLQVNLGDGYTAFTCKGNPKNCPGWADDHGHGTHVAGTIGAADNGSGVVGVAPEVTLHAVKVLDANGSGQMSGIIAGIDWVAGHNRGVPRVANMSLGGTGPGKTGTCTTQGLIGSTDAAHTALCNARNTGVVFAVSAGNTGGNAANRSIAAYYDAVLTVSATSCRFTSGVLNETCETGSEAFTTWSSWGTGEDAGWPSEGSLPVVIAAPGANVLSARHGGGHSYASGTSMAAPHVAGGVALVLQSLAGSQSADGSAFSAVRAALLGATECTATWHNLSGNPHNERFLNLRSPDPITECVEPGDPPVPPPVAPTDLRVVGVTSSSIDLAWEHGSPGDARFEVWRWISSEWKHLTYVDGAASYTDSGLAPNFTYYYIVRTANESGVSAWSEVVGGRTLPLEGGPGPVAEFTSACGNSATCSFSNASTGSFSAASWHWDLGNGQTSTSYNPPPVTYTSAGNYTVQLRVEDVLGRTDDKSVVIACAMRGNRLRCQ